MRQSKVRLNYTGTAVRNTRIIRPAGATIASDYLIEHA